MSAFAAVVAFFNRHRQPVLAAPAVTLADALAPLPPRRVCGWCSTEMAPGCEPASHGICEPCAHTYFPQQAAKRKEQA